MAKKKRPAQEGDVHLNFKWQPDIAQDRDSGKGRVYSTNKAAKKARIRRHWSKLLILSPGELEEYDRLDNVNPDYLTKEEDLRLRKLERRRNKSLLLPEEVKWATKNLIPHTLPVAEEAIARRKYWVERVYIGEQGMQREDAIDAAHNNLETIIERIETEDKKDIDHNNFLYQVHN